MAPVLELPIIGHAVQSYAVVRTAYLLMALVLVTVLNERQGISGSVTLRAFAVGGPAGIFGAHLLDMAEYPLHYSGVGDVFAASGSSIYGALLAAFVVAWGIARWQRVPALQLLDAGAPAFALGEAMTRIGCFVNGCCYGTPYDGTLSVVFPKSSFAFRDQVARHLLEPTAAHSLPVHPVQLYSAVVALAATIGLTWMFLRPHRTGMPFFAFVVFYGALRLAIAPIRMEALGSMKAFSILFIALGVGGMGSMRWHSGAVAGRPVRIAG